MRVHLRILVSAQHAALIVLDYLTITGMKRELTKEIIFA